jgi:hypothetical protein
MSHHAAAASGSATTKAVANRKLRLATRTTRPRRGECLSTHAIARAADGSTVRQLSRFQQ